MNEIELMQEDESPEEIPGFDPRQKRMWELYINPQSETFGNAYQSAMKAGYTEGTASKITTARWYGEKLRRLNLMSKAEKVLDETLEVPHIVQAMGAFGPLFDKQTKEPIMKVGTEILKIKADVAKFVAETQGKNDGYSKKVENEHSGEIAIKPTGMVIK